MFIFPGGSSIYVGQKRMLSEKGQGRPYLGARGGGGKERNLFLDLIVSEQKCLFSSETKTAATGKREDVLQPPRRVDQVILICQSRSSLFGRKTT